MSVLSDTGRQSLSVRYSAYGVPFGSPAGDLNADGAVDFTDSNQIASWISGSVYDVRADINLDGVVDSTDQTLLSGANYGLTLGRGKLAAGQTSAAWTPGVRKGYAGYEHDGVVNPAMHVRNRVLLGELGRWTRRDPLGYVDGVSLYEYVSSQSQSAIDPAGLRRVDSGKCFPQDWNYVGGCAFGGGGGGSNGSVLTPEGPGGGGGGGGAPPCSDVGKIACIIDAGLNPEPSSSSVCNSYSPCDQYLGANAGCFCRCAGNTPWAQYVRSCLACMYSIGCGNNTSHLVCYGAADEAFPGGRPDSTLASCYAQCLAIQYLVCWGAPGLQPVALPVNL